MTTSTATSVPSVADNAQEQPVVVLPAMSEQEAWLRERITFHLASQDLRLNPEESLTAVAFAEDAVVLFFAEFPERPYRAMRPISLKARCTASPYPEDKAIVLHIRPEALMERYETITLGNGLQI